MLYLHVCNIYLKHQYNLASFWYKKHFPFDEDNMDVDIDIFVGNNTLLDPEIYEMWLFGQQGGLILHVSNYFFIFFLIKLSLPSSFMHICTYVCLFVYSIFPKNFLLVGRIKQEPVQSF